MENKKIVLDILKEAEIAYAVLDDEDRLLRILIHNSQKKQWMGAAKNKGLKQIKDKSGDVYLYGMDHFLYYDIDGERLIVCCQLACRSTLNGEWVPLDRKINNGALDKAIYSEEDKAYAPGAEDFLCYLLAKCVYTEGGFSDSDKQRIEQCMSKTKKQVLMPKLEGVFFCFTEKLLQMLEAKDYDSIIEALYRYAEY